MSEYQTGQFYPLERSVGVFEKDAPDLGGWFALRSRPNQMGSAVAFLLKNGVEAWFPTKRIYQRHRFRTGQRIIRDVPLAPGYVFAKFPGMPFWDRLFDAYPGKLYLGGVVGLDGVPKVIHEREMAEMAQLPTRLEEARTAQADARRVRQGDRATVVSGPFAGWVVDVADVTGGMADLVIPLLGARRVAASVESLERVVK